MALFAQIEKGKSSLIPNFRGKNVPKVTRKVLNI